MLMCCACPYLCGAENSRGGGLGGDVRAAAGVVVGGSAGRSAAATSGGRTRQRPAAGVWLFKVPLSHAVKSPSSPVHIALQAAGAGRGSAHG